LQTLDIEAIKEILPHRYPFLMVDRVTELEPGIRAVGMKNVTVNEPYFQGHFPKRAIMPGVMLIETMAQVGGIMIQSQPEHRMKLALLGTVDNVKFRRPVTPGDTLVITTELIRARGNNGRVRGFIQVGETVVAEAEIMFVLVV
jgi:3-hydroxyacyl-[acyl-carrier-protein] dehydratase